MAEGHSRGENGHSNASFMRVRVATSQFLDQYPCKTMGILAFYLYFSTLGTRNRHFYVILRHFRHFETSFAKLRTFGHMRVAFWLKSQKAKLRISRQKPLPWQAGITKSVFCSGFFTIL